MHSILEEMGSTKKTAFLGVCKERLSLSRARTSKLFEIGQGRFWRVEHLKAKNVHMVHPIQFSSLSSLYSAEKLKNSNSDFRNDYEGKNSEPSDIKELSSFPKGLLKTEKQDVLEVDEVIG